jgi:hypothetical protein
MQPFRKLGELVLGNACPWVSRVLAANMLTPLFAPAGVVEKRPFPPFSRACYPIYLVCSCGSRWKMPPVNDARPVSAKDCDYAVWNEIDTPNSFRIGK